MYIEMDGSRNTGGIPDKSSCVMVKPRLGNAGDDQFPTELSL